MLVMILKTIPVMVLFTGLMLAGGVTLSLVARMMSPGG